MTAIDPSDDQLDYARARPGVRMTDFRVGDAQNLAFADSIFDVAVMALVISFLPDPGRAAAEIGRRSPSPADLPGTGIDGYDFRAPT